MDVNSFEMFSTFEVLYILKIFPDEETFDLLPLIFNHFFVICYKTFQAHFAHSLPQSQNQWLPKEPRLL